MFKRALICGAVLCASTSLLQADFTYEQSSKVTGGVMAGMMKVAGAFSKQAREPMRSTILVKGNRMATVHTDRIDVIDLDKETMTAIDLGKKTYATITFAEMAQAMAKMAEKMNQSKTDPNAEMNFNMDVKNTGQSRVINGLNANQTIMTLEVEAKDKKSGESGAMQIISDMWLTPKIAGYNEVQDFYTKMAQKMAWSAGGPFSSMAMMRPEMGKGMAKLAAEASKMDGIPVFQVVRMGGKGQIDATPSTPDAAQAKMNEQGPTAGQVAGDAAAGAAARAALGKLGGLGGFGGFGRKKKEQQQQEQPASQQQPPAQPAGNNAGLLMEITTETTNFSSAPLDAAKFEVPAGFKQVEHDMKKALK